VDPGEDTTLAVPRDSPPFSPVIIALIIGCVGAHQVAECGLHNQA
jgi:hypothetical protein